MSSTKGSCSLPQAGLSFGAHGGELSSREAEKVMFYIHVASQSSANGPLRSTAYVLEAVVLYPCAVGFVRRVITFRYRTFQHAAAFDLVNGTLAGTLLVRLVANG